MLIKTLHNIRLNLVILILCLAACASNQFLQAPEKQEHESQTPGPQPITVAHPVPVDLQAEASRSSVINPEDSISISVYNDSSLNKTQTVRPDGYISMLLVGDIKVDGLTIPEARDLLTQKLKKFFVDPKVDVSITEYASHKVYILGRVNTAGVYTFKRELSLLEALTLAGGITDRADLGRAYLLRKDNFVPVDFSRLLIDGDLTQNARIQAQDVIVIPDDSEQKVFVLGEVSSPGVALIHNNSSTLMEAITDAKGFTNNAARDSVLLIRGNLTHPQVFKLDAEDILKNGYVNQNMLLRRGDIVYVPSSTIADVEKFFNRIYSILLPIVATESGINLLPDVTNIIKHGERKSSNTTIITPIGGQQ